jgi:predicted HTH domain antitoxin
MGHTVRFDWDLPEPLLAVVAKDRTTIAEEVKQAAVLDWVRIHRISWRKGAELLGMPLRDFMGLMSQHKVPAAEYQAGWLEDELGALESASSQGKAPSGR